MKTNENSTTESEAANPDPAISPGQLKSDMDTIKSVLADGERERDKGPHRVIIATANLFIGLLFLVWVLGLYVGPFMAGMIHAMPEAPKEGGTPPMLLVVAVGLFILLIVLLIALPFLLTGWGLLKRRSWGTVAAVVAAVINLVLVPIGTALGVYTFWAVSKGKLPTRSGG